MTSSSTGGYQAWFHQNVESAYPGSRDFSNAYKMIILLSNIKNIGTKNTPIYPSHFQRPRDQPFARRATQEKTEE